MIRFVRFVVEEIARGFGVKPGIFIVALGDFKSVIDPSFV